MSVIDLETVEDAFNKYCDLLSELNEAREDLKEIELENTSIKFYLNILEALNFANKNSFHRYDETIEDYLERHKELAKMIDLKHYIGTCLNDISFLETTEICSPLSQIILLNKENKKYLVDLKYFGQLDVTNFNADLLDFIINILEKQGIFIGNANQSDLPFLMVIKEELEKDTSDDEDSYYVDDFVAYQMGIEYKNAKIADQKTLSNKRQLLPFILDSDEVQKKWKELDELESSITREEYLKEYYRLLLVFGNDVEKVYLEAPDDEKKYVIDAYKYYSSDDCESIHHFRTTSTLINIEILKEKRLIKK